MKLFYFVVLCTSSTYGRIVKRQGADDLLCCRCVDARIGCDEKLKALTRMDGLTCKSEFDCFVANKDFQRCDSCEIFGNSLSPSQSGLSTCEPGFISCCSEADRGLLEDISVRIGLATSSNPLGEITKQTERVEICKDDKIRAITNMREGRVCGKRDSRVYTHVDRPDSFTNPGEWPWTVMLLEADEKYVGAGAFIAENTVVTVAHKVIRFLNDPGSLRVRLGDWKPRENAPEEVFDYEEYEADCIKMHPEADLENTLANNVAVIKFTRRPSSSLNKPENTVLGVVNLRRTNSETPAFNSVCLPQGSTQFSEDTGRCWVAAWGADLDRQREVDLPLLSRDECTRRLRPTFSQRGVKNWSPQPSELCAGGEVGKDTCTGEGGAPLVCLDQDKDQYFAVGLVNYGFSCNTTLPAVYTNLMDPSVNSFIKRGIRDNFC